jgi:hypothetical protein
MGKITICECGLAKCYHEGSNPLAYRRQDGLPPLCMQYKPRPEKWWEQGVKAAEKTK